MLECDGHRPGWKAYNLVDEAVCLNGSLYRLNVEPHCLNTIHLILELIRYSMKADTGVLIARGLNLIM